jgi:hypothetical protein
VWRSAEYDVVVHRERGTGHRRRRNHCAYCCGLSLLQIDSLQVVTQITISMIVSLEDRGKYSGGIGRCVSLTSTLHLSEVLAACGVSVGVFEVGQAS